MSLQRRIVRPVADRVSQFWRDIPGVPRPTLDLDFAAGHLPAGIWNVERACEVSERGNGGMLVFRGSDEAAMDRRANGRSRGLRVLGAAQNSNHIIRSTDMNTSFTKARATVSTNVMTAPDGSTTGAKLIEDSSLANSHVLNQNFAGTAENWMFYVFAKKAERWGLVFRAYDGSVTVATRYMDLANGAWGGAGSGGTMYPPEDWGDGWYRYAIKAPMTTSISCEWNVSLANADGSFAYDGDGASGAYVWGAMAHPGGFPAPFVRTLASAVTGQADSLEIGGEHVKWNAQGGTVLVELAFDESTSGGIGWGSGISNFHYVSFPPSGTNMRWRAGSVNQVTGAGAAPLPSLPAALRYAASFSTTVHRASLDGQTDRDDAGAYVMVASPTFHLDHAASFGADGDNPLNGHLRRFIYWPEVFALDVLNRLTAPGAA